MMTRSILVGWLAVSSSLLGGCVFEEPMIVDADASGTEGSTVGTTTAPTTETSTTGPTTTVGPTTDPTVADSTTTEGPLDTTAENTSDVTATSDTSTTSTTGDPCVAACEGLACGTTDDCECGECSGMNQCAADQTYCAQRVGFFNDFGFSSTVGGQLQLGFRFTVAAPTNVRRLGLIAWGAGANVRMAVYEHDGAGPQSRVVQTAVVQLYANGVNEFDVPPTPIAPGDYWVMLHTETSTPLRRTLNGDNGHEEALRTMIPFAAGFPDVMNDEAVLNDYRYNLYMVIEE